MNLVDSSGWLEYFSEGPNASAFERILTDTENLLVPTLCLYEVFKVVLRERGENEALQVVALMRQGSILELTAEIALLAARTSLDLRIPMADSVILATGRLHGAVIWTQDSDFKNIRGVKYIARSGKERR